MIRPFVRACFEPSSRQAEASPPYTESLQPLSLCAGRMPRLSRRGYYIRAFALEVPFSSRSEVLQRLVLLAWQLSLRLE
jgi:hypothetical protein